LEINGSGQAGGAISRIGWGRMRETLLSRHCARQYNTTVPIREKAPKPETPFIESKRRAISDYFFPLAESQSFLHVVVPGTDRSRSQRERRFLVLVRSKN
jgi:hypothetical protein